MASFHHFSRVARIDLGDAHRLLISQRELLRAIATASLGRDEGALNEVLHRAAAAASTSLTARPQLILPPPTHPTLAVATWNSVLASLRHAVHVARESLPAVGSVAAIAAIAALAMHVTSVWVPRWMAANNRPTTTRRTTTRRRAASTTTPTTPTDAATAPATPLTPDEVAGLMEEVTALRAELEHYRAHTRDVDALVASHEHESATASAHVAQLEEVNAALARSVEALEAELGVRRAAEEGLRGEVAGLRGAVAHLTEERDRADARMQALEGSLESLRVLFSSIAGGPPAPGAASPASFRRGSAASSVGAAPHLPPHLFEPPSPGMDVLSGSQFGSALLARGSPAVRDAAATAILDDAAASFLSHASSASLVDARRTSLVSPSPSPSVTSLVGVDVAAPATTTTSAADLTASAVSAATPIVYPELLTDHRVAGSVAWGDAVSAAASAAPEMTEVAGLGLSDVAARRSPPAAVLEVLPADDAAGVSAMLGRWSPPPFSAQGAARDAEMYGSTVSAPAVMRVVTTQSPPPRRSMSVPTFGELGSGPRVAAAGRTWRVEEQQAPGSASVSEDEWEDVKRELRRL
ncbi:hypothetical protein HDU96_005798 [Phlyctochytrium bullatum]|nr:hypothetical protein HDU96_005798 [Phlyctochytrium bullatum]